MRRVCAHLIPETCLSKLQNEAQAAEEWALQLQADVDEVKDELLQEQQLRVQAEQEQASLVHLCLQVLVTAQYLLSLCYYRFPQHGTPSAQPFLYSCTWF